MSSAPVSPAFFFQAEDGIRGCKVTGVQTCALPIWEGPAQALARSWRLVRGSFWRVLGITVLAGVIVLVTAGVLQIPFGLFAAMAGGGNSLLPSTGGNVASILISAVGGVVAGAVARPISAGVAVLLYVDLRMRREGLDLVLQTAAGGDAPT